jgi:hypothetical protein
LRPLKNGCRPGGLCLGAKVVAGGGPFVGSGLSGGDRLLSGWLLAQVGCDGVEVDQGGGACCL